MKKQVYQHPNIKVHVPSPQLLQTVWDNGTSPRPDDVDIESKGNNAFDEDEQTHMWGRVWGRVDD